MMVVLVVVIHPLISKDPQHSQAFEQIGIKDILSKKPVQPLDKGILHWLSGADAMNTDVVPLAPLSEGT